MSGRQSGQHRFDMFMAAAITGLLAAGGRNALEVPEEAAEIAHKAVILSLGYEVVSQGRGVKLEVDRYPWEKEQGGDK